MDVRDYLKILQARWKIVAVVTVVVILGALGASLIATPIYQASTRLFRVDFYRNNRERGLPR